MRRGKDERRIYISMELDDNDRPIGDSLKLNTSLSDFTPYLNNKERRYLTKKMRSNRNTRTVYKKMHFEKRFF